MPYYNGDSDLELGYYLEQYLTMVDYFLIIVQTLQTRFPVQNLTM